MRFDWFIVEPSREDLSQIGTLLDAGQVRPIVDKCFRWQKRAKRLKQARKGTRAVRSCSPCQLTCTVGVGPVDE